MCQMFLVKIMAFLKINYLMLVGGWPCWSSKRLCGYKILGSCDRINHILLFFWLLVATFTFLCSFHPWAHFYVWMDSYLIRSQSCTTIHNPQSTILLRGSLGICPLASSHGTYCEAAKVNGFNALHSTKMFILFIIKQIWIDNAHLQRTSQLLLGSCNNFNISRSLTFAVLEFPLDWTFRAIWILAFLTWDPDM